MSRTRGYGCHVNLSDRPIEVIFDTHVWKEEYREIRVALNGDFQAAGYRLTYRHGYYADDANQPRTCLATATRTTGSAAFMNTGDNYWRIAMVHGAPTPEDPLQGSRTAHRRAI